jgi:hypothetical protein
MNAQQRAVATAMRELERQGVVKGTEAYEKYAEAIKSGVINLETQREDLDRNLGLRHRAGLGLGDESDAVSLVVSEETGQVSICHGGKIERNLSVEKFRQRLSQLLLDEKYESDPSQQLENQTHKPSSGLRPLVSHQAERQSESRPT